MILNKLLNANLYILLFTTIIFLIISRYIYLVTAFCNKWHEIINNPKYSYTSQHNANHLIYTYHISLKYRIAIKSVSYCINNTILFSVHFSKAVEEYIDYYNNKRIQAKTKWMPPVQYRITSICFTWLIIWISDSPSSISE